MSGFEVVGVVLGAIPLLISAIEKYKATSQRLKYFKYKEPYIAQLIQSLEDQKFFLESDLYIPLNSTHLEEDQINHLLCQPNPDLFQDAEISQALREYLGDGYAPYQRAAHPMKNGKYELTKKIKFSLQKEDLEKRIKDLNDSTAMLRRIRETSALKTDVTLQSTSRTITKFTSALNTVQNYAHRLYSAISDGT
ncbi:unnamed protein product [Penicillium manginii]